MDEQVGAPLFFAMIFLLSLFCLVVRFYLARKSAIEAKKRKNPVLARVKEKKDGVWFCKFFLCGDHIGFFRTRPSADRVNAFIVRYDQRRACFELKEILPED